ncbi:MAG TPA: UvrD-helicase domain-containing protein [Longimicrobiales bacterium]
MAEQASHLGGLNPEQRSAVLHTEGPVLILAGAGSGKTRTLVHRIVHLIRDKKVPPHRIIAVTFTNKAADEMRERVRSFAGEDAKRVVVSTFHALGARILREHHARAKLPKRFAIYGTGDQLGALRTACAEVSVGNDVFDFKRVLKQISDWKGRGLTPAAAVREVASAAATGNRHDDYAVIAADAYPRYDEVLRACGAVDFDDLLLLPVTLLQEHEDVARDLWRRWHYLMVDEYQDTNAVQLHLARLIAGPRRNLCVVGDDDQSIYAFRGADVGNILDFEQHFTGAKVITLEENYRSTQRILGAANAIIAGNAHRHAKKLRTSNGIGAQIEAYEHEHEIAEAEAVAKEISVRRYARKVPWEEFAVLYRTNPQARVLEEAMRTAGIPYRVMGGSSFFERKEVADCVAYLRAAVYPDDEIAIRRIINFPQRGIGRTTVLKVADYGRAQRIPFSHALADAASAGVGAAQAAAIAGFLSQLDAARTALAAAEHTAASPPPQTGQPAIAAWAEQWFREIGIFDAIHSDPRNDKSAVARVENVKDLAGTIARYERRAWSDAPLGALTGSETAPGDEDWESPTLAGALASLALAELEMEEEEATEKPAAVSLMTLHSAKGLEFSDVFLVGLEEGILPHARSIVDDADGFGGDPIAEERRLLYVGITRARQRLTVSFCRTRRKGGQTETVLPSRYLEDLPEDLVLWKTADAVLTPEESTELRKNFFDHMRTMLEDQ